MGDSAFETPKYVAIPNKYTLYILMQFYICQR